MGKLFIDKVLNGARLLITESSDLFIHKATDEGDDILMEYSMRLVSSEIDCIDTRRYERPTNGCSATFGNMVVGNRSKNMHLRGCSASSIPRTHQTHPHGSAKIDLVKVSDFDEFQNSIHRLRGICFLNLHAKVRLFPSFSRFSMIGAFGSSSMSGKKQ